MPRYPVVPMGLSILSALAVAGSVAVWVSHPTDLVVLIGIGFALLAVGCQCWAKLETLPERIRQELNRHPQQRRP